MFPPAIVVHEPSVRGQNKLGEGNGANPGSTAHLGPPALQSRRVRPAIIGALILTLLAACRGSKQASSDPSSTGAPQEVADTTQYQITRQKLDAFLRYHSLRSVELGDAGQAASPERQATDFDRARTAAGLSVQDLEQLESIVTKVIGKRAFARQLADDQSLEMLENVKAKVPLHRQKELEQLVSWNRAQRDQALSLLQERKRYGDANVDLILTREGELLRIWDSELAQLTP